MIYCLSQHHTGTWTSIAWLLSHKDVKGFLQEAHAHDALEGEEIIHEVESGQYTERFDPAMVYHQHIHRDPNSEKIRICAAQMVMMATTATLIPIRDPLASLVTYQKWADRDGRSAQIGERFSPKIFIDIWCCMAESWFTLQRFAHVRFVCWDLLMPGWAPAHLAGVAKDLGLTDPEPSQLWNDRPIHDNTAGDYPLKAAYQQRDANALRKGISENGYNYLVSKGLQLRPFLESLGYRNLQWWS